MHELGYEFGQKIEPTTKNDLGVDCISRTDVLKLMQDNRHTHNGDWAMQESMDDIRALPLVTPIRPKGHWIYDKSIADWICSKCGETPKTIGYVGTGAFMAEHFKYCNHCGAEMEGVEK